MTTKTLPDYERLIAQAKKPCSDCQCRPESYCWCQVCFGARQVLRYPWASEECPRYNAVSHFVAGRGMTLRALEASQRWCRSGNDDCHGTGRISTVDWLRVAEELAELGDVLFGRGDDGWWVELGLYHVEEQPDLATALCAALVEAEGLNVQSKGG